MEDSMSENDSNIQITVHPAAYESNCPQWQDRPRYSPDTSPASSFVSLSPSSAGSEQDQFDILRPPSHDSLSSFGALSLTNIPSFDNTAVNYTPFSHNYHPSPHSPTHSSFGSPSPTQSTTSHFSDWSCVDTNHLSTDDTNNFQRSRNHNSPTPSFITINSSPGLQATSTYSLSPSLYPADFSPQPSLAANNPSHEETFASALFPASEQPPLPSPSPQYEYLTGVTGQFPDCFLLRSTSDWDGSESSFGRPSQPEFVQGSSQAISYTTDSPNPEFVQGSSQAISYTTETSNPEFVQGSSQAISYTTETPNPEFVQGSSQASYTTDFPNADFVQGSSQATSYTTEAPNPEFVQGSSQATSYTTEAPNPNTYFKAQVASDAAVAVSEKKRKNPHRYTCTICGRGFTRNHSLKSHEQAHTGQRNLLCNFCGKYFAGTLSRHKKNCKHNPNRQLSKEKGS